MTRRAGPSTRRSLAVGLALFGLFFQLFLPISLAAAAEPGAPNRVLEICAADGIVRVPLPAADEAGAAGDSAAYVEACNHCVLHGVTFTLPERAADALAHPFTVGERISFPTNDIIRETAATAGFDARGPPMRTPIQGKA